MADDKTERGPQDGKLINLSENHEIQYWTMKFGVSSDRLADAVRKVGGSPEAVEAELKT